LHAAQGIGPHDGKQKPVIASSSKDQTGGNALQNPLSNTRRPAIVLLFVLLFRVNPAGAQDVLSDSQIQERLQAIQHMLEQGKPNADRWWYGWLIGYGAATIAQGAIGLTSNNKDTRQDMALGAATTFLGVMGQIMAPMVPGTAPDRISGIPESTPAERKAKLAEAESVFRESALRERDGRSWKIHAITGAVNLGSGLIVWLGFKRSIWEGLGNFALNTAVTELQIWTQPTRAVRDYDRYTEKYASEQKVGSHKPEITWSVNIYPGGLGISVMF
jgi:hypothetical protein